MFGWSSKQQHQPPRIPRATHLNSYLNDQTLKPSTRKVGHDDSTHDTVFQTKSGNALILRVHLRDAAPMMTLVGITATHPWIDDRLRVTGYAPIQSLSAWESSGLTLGRAVNAVVKHFQFYPPSGIRIVNAALNEIQMRMSRTMGKVAAEGAGERPVHQFVNKVVVREDQPAPFAEVLVFDDGDAAMHESMVETMGMPPSAPTTFPQLDALPTPQINILLHNASAFQTTVSSLPFVHTMKSIHHAKATEIRNLATDNLARQTSLQTLHDEVSALRDGLAEKVEGYDALVKRSEELCAPADRRETVKRLTVGKKGTYGESEEMANGWLEEGGDVDGFLRGFIEVRTVHHVRAAKIERVMNE